MLLAELAPPLHFSFGNDLTNDLPPNAAAYPPWPEKKQNTYAWRGGEGETWKST